MNKKTTDNLAMFRGRGFTLIEVLITVFVMALGMLGFAALQTQGIKFNRTADLRTQATQLTYNISDRIRANVTAAVNGTYVASSQPSPAYDCSSSFSGTATVNVCSPTEMANADLDIWYDSLTTALPSGTGSISCADSDATDADPCTRGSLHSIQVQWQEAEGTGFASQTFSLNIQP